MQMSLKNCFTNSFAIEYDISSNDDSVLCLPGNVGISIKQKVCPKLAMYSLYLPHAPNPREKGLKGCLTELSSQPRGMFQYPL